MADSEVRQRKPAKADEASAPSTKTKTRSSSTTDEDKPAIWLDALRVLTFLILASCGLSYVISGGKSFVWGKEYQPQYFKVDWWKAQFRGPLHLTPEELAAYDGSDPEKPIYLAINGTIYDVTKGRGIYGPGGSYNWFAGVDASRAYVTGCFAEDRTPDMRGVELMYLPRDDPDVDAYWTADEMAALKAKELAEANEKVEQGLKHWANFFANSDKYSKVGTVKQEEGWLEKTKPKELCASAEKRRSKRKIPKQ